MFLGLGKEAISIMFAIFSVAVTLFASSSQFNFDNGDDDNVVRKLNFLTDFNQTQADLKNTEKFILYNADLSQDKRRLSQYDVSLDYKKSIKMYDDKEKKYFEAKEFFEKMLLESSEIKDPELRGENDRKVAKKFIAKAEIGINAPK